MADLAECMGKLKVPQTVKDDISSLLGKAKTPAVQRRIIAKALTATAADLDELRDALAEQHGVTLERVPLAEASQAEDAGISGVLRDLLPSIMGR